VTPPRVAAIDLGSNSAKLLVAEAGATGLRRVLELERITRVSEGVERGGQLAEAALERTLGALGELMRRARAAGAAQVRCVATAGLRGTGGADRLLARARDALGLVIEIIDGEEEARLSFRSTHDRTPDPRWVVDVGGRSTELACGAGADPARAWSLELGGVRLHERFRPADPPRPEDLEAIRSHVRARLGVVGADARASGDTRRLVGVSGTALAALGLELEEPDVRRVLARADGRVLERSRLRAHRERLARVPAEARVLGSVIPPGRADVVVLGLLVLEEVLDAVGAPALEPHPGGIAPGVARALLGT
jgi:exopolyphosphatase/guanosine-5'-triphosphate,3'-diphosphate pyrophosphatase